MSVSSSPVPSLQARDVALRYAALERFVRRQIDRVAFVVCPRCGSPCCRSHYCRETGRNPWYRFVAETAGGFALPGDWAARRDPFGLGAGGCEIQAGRYVFCYSYNCPRLLSALPEAGRVPFQELSDLLLAANRLPGGRSLHEVRRLEELGTQDMEAIDREVQEALRRAEVLTGRIAQFDPTPHPEGRQGPPRGNP